MGRTVVLDERSNGEKIFRLTSTYRDTELVDIIASARLDASDRVAATWIVPATLAGAWQIRNSFGSDVEWSSEARQFTVGVLRDAAVMCKHFTGEAWANLVVPEGKSLFDYQKRDASRMVAHGSCVLAADMGLGKTVTTSVALETSATIAGAGSSVEALIICTPSTINVWRQHLLDWTSFTPFEYAGGQRAKSLKAYEAHEGPKALIVSNGLVQKHASLASYGALPREKCDKPTLEREWDYLIVDESHKLGYQPDGAKQRAMLTLSRLAKVRWSLTGTPINNRVRDMWVAMRVCMPDYLGEKGRFEKRYAIMREGLWGNTDLGVHPDMADELVKVTEPYFMRRTKEDWGASIPDSLPPQEVVLPLEGKQKTMYRRMVKDAIASDGNGGVVVATNLLDRNRKLEYLASWTMPDERELSAPSNKLAYILELAEERDGDPLVVYTWSALEANAYTTYLQQAGHVSAAVTGKTTRTTRDQLFETFQKSELPVLVITNAAAEGVTLTATDLIVVARESWHLPDNQQVQARHNRIGQTRTPQVQILISEGTIDVTKHRRLNRHETTQDEVQCTKQFLTDFWTPKMEW